MSPSTPLNHGHVASLITAVVPGAEGAYARSTCKKVCIRSTTHHHRELWRVPLTKLKVTQVSSAACRCVLFCHFHSRSGYNASKELCFVSHAGVTATAEPSAIRFISFHPTKPHLDGRNYYADRLLFLN